eukprot:scaffold7982_cov110-Isochrysis_galbana.AAC.3
MSAPPRYPQVRDPKTDELVHKSVFLIFFSGERSFEKMAKIADAFGAHRYNYPTQYQRRAALHTQARTEAGLSPPGTPLPFPPCTCLAHQARGDPPTVAP